MSIREEQCNKVCRILDDVLANRPTERDSLIVAVRKAFEALELIEKIRTGYHPQSLKNARRRKQHDIPSAMPEVQEKL